jgi:hypothetical protein
MILMMNAHGFSWVYDEVRLVRFGNDNYVISCSYSSSEREKMK